MITGRLRKIVNKRIAFLIILAISLFIFSSNCVRISFAQSDLDGDGISNVEDNCPTVQNILLRGQWMLH